MEGEGGTVVPSGHNEGENPSELDVEELGTLPGFSSDHIIHSESDGDQFVPTNDGNPSAIHISHENSQPLSDSTQMTSFSVLQQAVAKPETDSATGGNRKSGRQRKRNTRYDSDEEESLSPSSDQRTKENKPQVQAETTEMVPVAPVAPPQIPQTPQTPQTPSVEVSTDSNPNALASPGTGPSDASPVTKQPASVGDSDASSVTTQQTESADTQHLFNQPLSRVRSALQIAPAPPATLRKVQDITDKKSGGVTNFSNVNKLISMMHTEKTKGGRLLLLQVLLKTRADMRALFLKRGVVYLATWLEEAWKAQQEESDSQWEVVLVPLLKVLASVPITLDMLQETGLGLKMRPLKKHPNEDIKQRATALISSWKAKVQAAATSPKPTPSVQPAPPPIHVTTKTPPNTPASSSPAGKAADHQTSSAPQSLKPPPHLNLERKSSLLSTHTSLGAGAKSNAVVVPLGKMPAHITSPSKLASSNPFKKPSKISLLPDEQSGESSAREPLSGSTSPPLKRQRAEEEEDKASHKRVAAGAAPSARSSAQSTPADAPPSRVRSRESPGSQQPPAKRRKSVEFAEKLETRHINRTGPHRPKHDHSAFERATHSERQRERIALEKEGFTHTHMKPLIATVKWCQPPRIENGLDAQLAAPPLNSAEREVQAGREETVLAAIYMNPSQIPETPQEPPREPDPTEEIRPIPWQEVPPPQPQVPEPVAPPPTPTPPAAPEAKLESALQDPSIRGGLLNLLDILKKPQQQPGPAPPITAYPQDPQRHMHMPPNMPPNMSPGPLNMPPNGPPRLPPNGPPPSGPPNMPPAHYPPNMPPNRPPNIPPGFPPHMPPREMGGPRGPPHREFFGGPPPQQQPPFGQPPPFHPPGAFPDGPAPRRRVPCKFFNTPRGCRHGDQCTFLHEGGGPPRRDGDRRPPWDTRGGWAGHEERGGAGWGDRRGPEMGDGERHMRRDRDRRAGGGGDRYDRRDEDRERRGESDRDFRGDRDRRGDAEGDGTRDELGRDVSLRGKEQSKAENPKDGSDMPDSGERSGSRWD